MQRRHFIQLNLAGLAGAALASPASGQGETTPDAPLEPLSFTTAEYNRRYEAIRAAMDEQGIDVLLITGGLTSFGAELNNLRYVGAAQFGATHAPEYVVFPKNGDPILLIAIGGDLPAFPPPPHVPLAREDSPVEAGPSEAPNYPATAIELIKRLGFESGTVGLANAKAFPTSDYMRIQGALPHATYVDAEPMMTAIRSVKSEEELAFVRRSARNCDIGHQAMMEMLRPGVTHRDIYYAVGEAMGRLGGAAPGTPQFIISKQSGGRPSFSNYGSDARVNAGDFITNEITTHYQGYFTQMIVPICLGEPTDEILEAWRLNDAMYKAVADALRPGATADEMNTVGAEALTEASEGRYRSLFTLMTVEKEKTLTRDWAVEKNVPFTLMPMLAPNGGPGFFGHVYANTVVTKDGPPEVLQQTPMDIVVV